MTLQPDLVGCWVFRIGSDGSPEILLIKRAPGRIYPGVWQCVTGKLEPGERVVDGALRELVEETGIGPDDIEALYSLDMANLFHTDYRDAIEVEAVFAVQVRLGVEPALSIEHDDARWVTAGEAAAIVVWAAYRTAIEQIEWLVRNPHHAPWLRTGAWAIDGSAPPDPPG